jgi:hypothetical protein
MKKRTMNKRGEKLSMPRWDDRGGRIKNKNKLCVICGKEFFGHAVRKYCDIHLDDKSDGRKKLRKIYQERINSRYPNINQENNFKNNEVLKLKVTCALPGCGESFELVLYPKQEVFPKYCEIHRSEHQRSFFKRMSHAA